MAHLCHSSASVPGLSYLLCRPPVCSLVQPDAHQQTDACTCALISEAFCTCGPAQMPAWTVCLLDTSPLTGAHTVWVVYLEVCQQVSHMLPHTLATGKMFMLPPHPIPSNCYQALGHVTHVPASGVVTEKLNPYCPTRCVLMNTVSLPQWLDTNTFTHCSHWQ